MSQVSTQWSPELCFIEISGACNAKCPYCVKGRGIQPQGRIMPVETFDRILQHLKLNRMLPKSGMIHLFNWGEPMLHPKINQILKTCGKYGLFAFISSNLIHLPELEAASLRLLTGVGISLSGFSQTSYSRIHGKNLKIVLDNINKLYLMAVKANCHWRPHVIWHRYQFNEKEMSSAKEYFSNRGIQFHPNLACLNGINLAMDYFFDNKLNLQEREKIEQDLFTDFIKDILMLSRTDKYECPQWSYLSIDENANLLLCCGWSNTVPHSVLGSFFDISAKQIVSLKRQSPLCRKCINRGIAKFGHEDLKDRLLDQYLSKGKSIQRLPVNEKNCGGYARAVVE